jgi:ribosome-associated protein
MSQRPAPGRQPAREADAAHDEAGRPSRTQRKKESQDLQSLGEDLVGLPDSTLKTMDMPESLREAIQEYRRTRSHEGQRRQMQYIGKVMRTVDPEPLREAVALAKLGGARDSLLLHQAERWRVELLADDDALTRWVVEHPETNVQELRALIRAAQQGPLPGLDTGKAIRQARSFRELFQFIRSHLTLLKTA